MTRATLGAAISELLRSAAILALVLAGAGAALTAADHVPGWILGEARDVRFARDVHDAERRVRARLLLPAYFPSTLAWPPERIRIAAGDPPAVAIVFTDRERAAPRLVLAQVLGPAPVPERLLPPARPLDETPVKVGSTAGTLRRIVGPDGSVWRELAWTEHGRTMVARSAGGVDELIRIARSAREAP